MFPFIAFGILVIFGMISSANVTMLLFMAIAAYE